MYPEVKGKKQTERQIKQQQHQNKTLKPHFQLAHIHGNFIWWFYQRPFLLMKVFLCCTVNLRWKSQKSLGKRWLVDSDGIVPAAAGHAGSSGFMALLIEMCLCIFESCAEYSYQMRFLMAAATLNCLKPVITTLNFLTGQREAFACGIACVSTLLGGEREQTGDRMWYWHIQPSSLAPIYPSAW